MYTWWIVISLMGPWIISGSPPHQPSGRGSFAENVKPCMDLVRLSTPSCSSCFPLFELIIKILRGWSHSLIVCFAFSASNLARRLRSTSTRFHFRFLSSISLLNTEQLTVLCVLLLWYSQYHPFPPFTDCFSETVLTSGRLYLFFVSLEWPKTSLRVLSSPKVSAPTRGFRVVRW